VLANVWSWNSALWLSSSSSQVTIVGDGIERDETVMSFVVGF